MALDATPAPEQVGPLGEDKVLPAARRRPVAISWHAAGQRGQAMLDPLSPCLVDANPYDPAWELYFEERLATQMASTRQGRCNAAYLWIQQETKCLVCGQPLHLEEKWHVHHLLARAKGGTDWLSNLVLLHPNCHRQVHSEGLVLEKPASREGRS